MKIAVLSGKGGTGKTFVSVNLATVAKRAVYLDCDVEEPNGHLFLKPENVVKESVYKLLPTIDKEKCNSCRKCVDFCKFNALAFIKDKPKLFDEVCHSCGGCVMVCPQKAISEDKHEIGHLEIGIHRGVRVASGILNIGEASGVGVISSLLKKGNELLQDDEIIIVDCPPGSACSVTESISDADYCLFVVEPTVFGVHNFQMVYELVELMGKPNGVVINKAPDEETIADKLCGEKNINVLARIPYTKEIAQMGANADIVSEKDSSLKELFTDLLEKIVEEAQK